MNLTRKLVPLTTAALLLTSGCSDASPEGGGPDADRASQTSDAAGSDEPDPDRGGGGDGDGAAEPARPVSPLDEYLGVGAGTVVKTDAAVERAYQESIARCMADEGFDYVPFVVVTTVTAMPDGTHMVEFEGPKLPDLPPAEFAAEFGYGISTAPPRSGGEEQDDPNIAIVDAMSVAERVAYHQAYYGRGVNLDAQGNVTSPLETADDSCSGKANRQASADEKGQRAIAQRTAAVEDAFAALLSRVRDLKGGALADARVTAGTATWGQCLAAAGFPGFDTLDGPRDDILGAARALLGPELDGKAADPAQLADLRRREIKLAVADDTCLQGWQATYDAVRLDLEGRFVKANAEELEDYRSAMSAALADQD